VGVPCAILVAAAWLALATGAASGASAVNPFPAPSCAEGWEIDGKVEHYTRDNLFDRINGEAEAYFPYGFDLLAYARYASRRDPRAAVDADVYRMGSPLDAFGIYAGYRNRENLSVPIGGGGALSPSRLLFHQGRYFVRLQATGTASPGEEVFLACARAISRRLPEDPGRPKELDAFAIPAVVPGSERYIARSLLGYDFFRRGLLADAAADGGTFQVFLVLEDSEDAASGALDRYRAYLKASGAAIRTVGTPDRESLTAADPLYGNVHVARAGRFLAGAVRFNDPSPAERTVGLLRERAAGKK